MTHDAPSACSGVVHFKLLLWMKYPYSPSQNDTKNRLTLLKQYYKLSTLFEAQNFNAKSVMKMRMIARCQWCNSPWVCWNWVYAFCGDRAAYEKANPHIKPQDLKDWGHDCWDCANLNQTSQKVRNGLPFWFVKKFYSPWKWLMRREKQTI